MVRNDKPVESYRVIDLDNDVRLLEQTEAANVTVHSVIAPISVTRYSSVFES